jgi:MFS family permease
MQDVSLGEDNRLDSALAWRMAIVAFVAGFVVFGVVYSFGVFLRPMAADLGAGQTATSAFFSIASLGFYFFGPLTGMLSDKFGPRLVVGAGAVAMGLGLVSTAFVQNLALGYLTYGLGVGFGAACAYIPTVANLGGWFVRHRNSALGIAAAGTGLGGLLLPPLAAFLIQNVGWRQADVIFGVGAGVLLSLCCLAVQVAPRVASQPVARPLWPVMRSRAFVALYLSWLLGTVALFIPFVYLPAFAMEQGASEMSAALLLSILGGVSIAGRLGISFLTRYMGTLGVYKAAVFMMPACFVVWILRSDYQSLLIFALLLGVAYGVRIAVVTAVLIDFFGVAGLGVLLGVFFTATGIAAVIGPLFGGLIIEGTGSFHAAAVFALVAGLAGFLVIAPLKRDRL